MDLVQMEDRIERVPEFIESHCYIDGYELCFNKKSSKDGSGKANIRANAKSRVYGILYAVTMDDLLNLDRWEFVHKGHYKRVKIFVKVQNRESIEAVTYIAHVDYICEGLKPTNEYLNCLVAGKYNLPDDYWRWLSCIECND